MLCQRALIIRRTEAAGSQTFKKVLCRRTDYGSGEHSFCFGTRKVFGQHSLVKTFNSVSMVRLIEGVPKPHVTQTSNQYALGCGDRAKAGDLISRDLTF